MKKEETQKEYNELIPRLGAVIYQFCVPIVQSFAMMLRLLELNQEMGKILKEEAECQKKQPKAGE